MIIIIVVIFCLFPFDDNVCNRNSQLLSFNFLYGEKDRKTLVPGVYCLLGGKSEGHYSFALNKLMCLAQSLNIEVAWKHCCADFERGLCNSLRATVPSLQSVYGYSFHFNKCIYGAVRKDSLCLKMYLSKKSVFRLLVRDIMSLAFVPTKLVLITYDGLISLYSNSFPRFLEIAAVLKFLNYFQRQWLNEAVIGDWNLFERDKYRTNNNLEGFHYYLQLELGVHVKWWKFVAKLKNLYAHKQQLFEGYRDADHRGGTIQR